MGVQGARFADPNPIFGRADELDAVRTALRCPTHRLVTLTGRGGVGKTRLAIEIVAQLAEAVETTVVALAGVSGSAYVLAEIAPALGVAPMANVDAREAVVARLQDDDHLLVLDNFEHVLDAAPLLVELLDRCGGLRILVTSQTPLHLRCERVVSIDPFPVPTEFHGDLDELVNQPAVATYLERASAVDLRFELDAANGPVVLELCRRLEGLPLAIELAAARAATLPAGEILKRFDRAGIGLLHRPRADVPGRHHGLDAAIAWTYGLLPPAEQRLLRRASVIAGTFDLDAVLALARPTDGSSVAAETDTDTIDALATLIDFHLIDPVAGARYAIASSIRAYAAAQRDEAGESAEVRSRHVAFRARQARNTAAGEGSGEAAALLASLDADHDDLQAALRSALDAGWADDALDLTCGLATLWDARGYLPAHETLLEESLALGERAGADPVRMVDGLLASALLGLHQTARVTPDVLVSRVERAEALARAGSDPAVTLRVLSAWMLITPSTGDVGRASAAVVEGLELAERTGNRGALRRIQVWAGMLAHLSGDVVEAVRLGCTALASARRHDDRATIVRAAMLLGPLEDQLPDELQDLPSSASLLELAREAGMPLYVTMLRTRLVSEAITAGDLPTSRRHALEALASARSMPGSQIVGFDLMAIVRLASASGDHGFAARIQGTLRSSEADLRQTLAQVQFDRYANSVTASREALGTDRFEAEARAGAALTRAQAVEAALTYVRGSTEAAASPHPRAEDPLERTGQPILTERQLEVLTLLADGLSNKEIAARLGLSPKSVMHHTTAIYRAIGAHGRSEATAWAFRAGITG
jgi:non-specific serine/threonine protein kinase